MKKKEMEKKKKSLGELIEVLIVITLVSGFFIAKPYIENYITYKLYEKKDFKLAKMFKECKIENKKLYSYSNNSFTCANETIIEFYKYDVINESLKIIKGI